MKVGDVLANWMRTGITPLEGEIQEVQRMLNVMQLNSDTVSKWTENPGQINLPSLFCDTPEFNNLPFDGVSVLRDATQSISNATYTNVIFDTISYQRFQKGYKYFDPDVSSEYLYIKRPGIYFAVASVRFAADADGTRELLIETESGATTLDIGYVSGLGYASAGTCLNAVGTGEMITDDTVHLEVWHNAGAALTIDDVFFTLYRIG